MFTDEWGGGTGARCRANDELNWGGDAIYDIVDGKLVFRSYYKIPPVQTMEENCVSHIPSLVPGSRAVTSSSRPGTRAALRWSTSAIRRTRSRSATTTAARSHTSLVLGGLWSTYWYNGATYGSEIVRGLDVWRLTPTAQMTQNEITAAA